MTARARPPSRRVVLTWPVAAGVDTLGVPARGEARARPQPAAPGARARPGGADRPAAGRAPARLALPAGVVRVHRPRRFDPARAALVVYVHGLYTDVDRAWRDHRLAAQFEASGRNALFVVPAARSTKDDPIPWPRLAPLLEAVRAARHPLPRGRLVLAGHSGAYRVIAGWLDDARVDTVLLLDGLYGHEADFAAWLRTDPRRRMALVNRDTAAAAAAWTQGLPFAVRRPRCPDRFAQLTARERHARVLSMGAGTDHMGVVTDGKILPLLLRWARLPA